MFRQLNDGIRFWWTLRRKPLEAFMEPVALAGDALLCQDGSLVTLLSIEGSRSITGSRELGEFVELAQRRLNGSFLDRGHAVHVMLERAGRCGAGRDRGSVGSTAPPVGEARPGAGRCDRGTGRAAGGAADRGDGRACLLDAS